MGASVFLVIVLLVACTSREEEAQRFVAARAAHQREWDSLWKLARGPDGQQKLDEASKLNNAWIREYGPRLRRIVEPIQMAGLTDSGTMLIGSQSGPYDNTDAPDGFRYQTTDSVEVYVSDTAIVRLWGAGMSRPNATPDVIMKNPTMYVGMFGVEAAPYPCAQLPVTSTDKHVLSAMAIEYSQDHGSGCNPDWIAVSILVGHRIIAAQRQIPPNVASDPKRLAAMAQALVDRLPAR